MNIVLLLDASGNVTWTGPSMADPGLDPAPLMGKPAAESLHPDADAARFRAGHAHAMLHPGVPVNLESLQLQNSSPLRFADETLICFPGESGNPTTLVVIHPRDVMDSPRPARPSESEEMLRQVVQLSQIGTFEHNHITGEIHWSRENRKIYGWPVDEPLNQSGLGALPRTWDLIHPHDRDRVAEAARRAHAGHNEGLFDLGYRIVRRDGEVRWLLTRAQTFFEGEGEARHATKTVGAVEDVTMHRQAARQLQLMKTSVDRSNVAIYWVNREGRVTYANELACTSLDRSRDEVLRMHVWDFDPSLSADNWLPAWEQTKRRRSNGMQTRHQRRDGSTFPVDLLGTYVNADGEELIFVFARDISQRELVERERRLMHAAIEKSRTPFFTLKPDGSVFYANDEACRMLGMTRGQVLRLKMWDIDPQLDPESQQQLWETLKREGVMRLDRNHRRADGSLVPVEITSNYVSFKDEEFILAFVQDITERTRADLALRRSEERLRQAILINDIGIFEHDLLTDRVHCSEELRRYLGLGEQQSVPFAAFEASLNAEDRDHRDQRIRHARDPSGDGKLRSQFRIIRPDGSVRWLESRSQTFFAGEGAARRPVRVVGAMADITERRNSEQRVNRKQRLESIGTMAGGIAHDLNNALTPILMTMNLLREQFPTEGELLDTVEQCANRAAAMVRHLLAYARGSEGKRVSVSPEQLIEEVARIVRGTFPKNIELRTRIESGLPGVLGDATQLHQVLVNLAVNARDAMPHGGVLTIEVGAVDEEEVQRIPELRDTKVSRYLAFSVTDTGIGIPSSELEHIFEPFFTTKKPEAGTGLGLFTVAGIVRGHAGHLQVQSQPGRGSTFSVFLPAVERRTDAEARRLIHPDFRGHGARILYVDDEPAVCEAARSVLRRLDFEAITAADGLAGLDRAIEYGDALCAVITDLNMPNMDGLSFARALRKLLPDVPLIVASGRPDAVSARDLNELGIHVLLAKPFTQDRLAVALQRALHAAREHRSMTSGKGA